jgi:hypothetical protein
MTVVDNQVAELMVLVRIDWSCRFDFSCGIQLKYVFVDVEYLLLALVNAIRVVQQVVPDFDDVVTKVQVAVDKGVIPGPKPRFQLILMQLGIVLQFIRHQIIYLEFV